MASAPQSFLPRAEPLCVLLAAQAPHCTLLPCPSLAVPGSFVGTESLCHVVSLHGLCWSFALQNAIPLQRLVLRNWCCCSECPQSQITTSALATVTVLAASWLTLPWPTEHLAPIPKGCCSLCTVTKHGAACCILSVFPSPARAGICQGCTWRESKGLNDLRAVVMPSSASNHTGRSLLEYWQLAASPGYGHQEMVPDTELTLKCLK